MTIESKMILGATASPETLRETGFHEGRGTAQFMVFQTVVDGKTYYCCHSGGKVIDGQVMLTNVGLAALDALIHLPLPDGSPSTLVMQELRIGKTPLVDKVRATFRMVQEGSRVCFFGDLAKELDGHMALTFNVTGAIGIGEIAAGGESCLH